MDSQPPTSIKDLRAKPKAVCNLQQRTDTPQALDFGSSSSRPNIKTETTPGRNRVPSTFCRYHARIDRILPHADRDFRDTNNPKGPNYRSNYAPRAANSGTSTQPTRSYNSQNRRAPASAQAQYTNQRQTPTTSETTNYNYPPGFDDHKPSESYEEFDSKLRRILDSAESPTNVPIPHTNMPPANHSEFTMTENGSQAPMPHTGRITIASPAGPLQTASVTTPTIPDTLVSVHDITHRDKALIFTHNKAWITDKS